MNTSTEQEELSVSRARAPRLVSAMLIALSISTGACGLDPLGGNSDNPGLQPALSGPTVALYHFDEQGSQALDASGNNLHADIFGAQRVPGVFGGGLGFGAAAARMVIPAMGEAFGSGQISVDFRIRMTTVNPFTTYHVVGGGTFGVQSYRVQVNDGHIEFLLNDGLTWQSIVTANQALTAETWYYVAVTFTGSEAVIYLNAAEDNRQSIAFALAPPVNTAYVGAIDTDTLDFGFARELPGDLDELRISNVALIAQEVSAQYSQVP